MCGKKFEIHISRIRNGEGKFCSRKCYGEWQSENRRGENSPNWKEKIKKECKECGKIFYTYPSKENTVFCSRECEYMWRAENLGGKNSPFWKGGKIKQICKQCGKEFELYPYRQEIAKYCSSLCARKAQEIPKHHTKPELIFEQICKKNNLDFHYVGDGQLWIGKDKVLNPDFIEANGKKICVEIMGAYWHSPLLNKNLRENALQSYRENHYKKYKWQPIFIWDTDLLRKDAESFVLNELSRANVAL